MAPLGQADDGRVRHRQGAVRLVGGVPYSDRRTTLSLLPGAAMGTWLASQAHVLQGRLLDSGCGNQPFREWYGPHVDEVVCMDAAPLPGVHVMGFANALPFADAAFDTVLLTQVLEHVDDVEAATAELVRVLRPGGHAIVTVPYLYPTHEAPYDFWRFTHYGLRSLLERHGLEVVALDAQGGGLLLLTHLGVLSVVGGLDAAWARLGGRRPLTHNRGVRPLLA